MQMKVFGAALMVAGAVAVVVGVVGYLGSSSSDGVAGEPGPTTSVTTATAQVTTTTLTTTIAPPSTTTVVTTTVAPATTTSMVFEAEETVEEFVRMFATALEEGDLDFIWQRLHPEVVAAGGEDLCRAWVENEIMALSDYTLYEVTGGPETVNGIPDVYSAAVSFTYQGQVFDDATGQYALVDGTFRWLGACR